MRRIIALTLIILTISGLAVANAATESPKFTPKVYKAMIGGNEYLIITPLDNKNSVLIAQKGSRDQYLVEGAISRSFAEAAELMIGKEATDKESLDFMKTMVEARKNFLMGDKVLAQR